MCRVRQNEIQNAMKTDSKTDKLSALVDLGTAMEYLSAIITYEKMLRICSPNIQKLKARKAYFDMIVSDIIARQITYCNWYCKFFLTKSSCM